MVWRSSRSFGCGKARSRSGKVIVVAHYKPRYKANGMCQRREVKFQLNLISFSKKNSKVNFFFKCCEDGAISCSRLSFFFLQIQTFMRSSRGNVPGEFTSNVFPPTDKFVGEEEEEAAAAAARAKEEAEVGGTGGTAGRRFLNAMQRWTRK